MNDALVAVIVLVSKENLPVGGESSGVYRVSVVLAGDIAPPCARVLAGLVVTAVTVSGRKNIIGSIKKTSLYFPFRI